MTHVGDFTLVRTEEFVEKILVSVLGQMTVSKVERDKLRSTGFDVEALTNNIEISMQECINSLENVEYIRKTWMNESL